MSSLSVLEDKYEGKTPQIITAELQSALVNAKSEIERSNINNNIEILRRFATNFYDSYFISCWSEGSGERDLMWRSYTKCAEAVAVQTTSERLKRSLPDWLDFGMVRYIDYKTEGFRRLNMFEWPMHKRLEFKDDQELRVLANALVRDGPFSTDVGNHLFEGEIGSQTVRICAPPIDISVLIESIYVHPHSDELFRNKVAKFCEENGLPEPHSSELGKIGSF